MTTLETLESVTDRLFPPGTIQRAQFVDDMRLIRRRREYFEKTTGWMRRIPFVGDYVWVWWSTLADEGLDGAVDAMCFAFLDDANPTARWHRWYRQEQP